MLSHLLLSIASAGVVAATAYTPEEATCPDATLVRSADSISSSEASYITSRKAVADKALSAWLSSALPSVDTTNLPTLALSTSGGGFRSLLTGAGVIQALDSRDSTASTAGLYQSLSYQAGLSGGGWLLSAMAAGNWPTISALSADVWTTQFAGGILDSSLSSTVADYNEIAQDIISKATLGYPVSLIDAWGRMLAYQIAAGGTGAISTTMAELATLGNFTDFNAPFPILTASKITYETGECNPEQDEAIIEFNPFEFGSWSDDISAFVRTEYLGSNLTNGVASSCTTGYDRINWVLGTSSNLLEEFVCNTSLGYDVSNYFPSAILGVVESYTSTEEYGYALVPNPFKGFTSTTSTATTSSVSDLDTLHLVDGGLPSHNLAILPLLEPSRNVSVLILNDNSNDDNGWPAGAAVVAAWEATQTGHLAGRFPAVPAAGDVDVWSRAYFFGCFDADAVTIIYLPNADWTYASNTSTMQLAYSAAQTAAMIENGNNVASQGGDDAWAGCVACAVMVKEVGSSNLPNECSACLAEYCA